MVAMMVASTGGHLHQLWQLSRRFADESDLVWVTFESEQSRSMLVGCDVHFVPYVAPRGYRALAACLPHARRLLKEYQPTSVVSTGSGVALGFLPLAAAKGIPTHYIESATRFDGPSFTGQMIARVPRVNRYTQWERWSGPKWGFGGSVFDGFEVEPTPLADTSIDRAVVSLGTIKPYGFRRLVERLVELLPPGCETLWQTGATDVDGLVDDAFPELPAAELRAAIHDADVVIAHAGTGIALTALEEGKFPLLVPRERAHGEHVDDHQFQTAQVMSDANLALTRTVDELTVDDLLDVARRSVGRSEDLPPFVLD